MTNVIPFQNLSIVRFSILFIIAHSVGCSWSKCSITLLNQWEKSMFGCLSCILTLNPTCKNDKYIQCDIPNNPQWIVVVGLLLSQVSATEMVLWIVHQISPTEWSLQSMCFWEIHDNLWWWIHDAYTNVTNTNAEGFPGWIDVEFAIVFDASWIMLHHCPQSVGNSFLVNNLTHNLTIF